MARRRSSPSDSARWGESELGPSDATFLQFAHPPCQREVIEFLITLLDVSPSMLTEDLEPHRLAVACSANGKLITTKAARHPKDIVGLITFGGEAHLRHRPVMVGNNAPSLLRALNDPCCADWTNFDAALTLAESVLLPPDKATAKVARGMMRLWTKVTSGDDQTTRQHGEISSTERCVRRVVLLSDGKRTKGPSPEPTAERLKARGVIIDCIGIADRANVDEATLKAIASRNPDGSVRYCFVQERESLMRKYESLAGHIRLAEE